MVHDVSVLSDRCPYCIENDPCPNCSSADYCILTLADDLIVKYNLFDFIVD